MHLSTIYRILRACFLMTPLLFAACMGDRFLNDMCVSDDTAIEEERITIRISRPGDIGALRAPVGGQTGDGYVIGNQWSPVLSNIDSDYKLHDLCIFMYQSEEASPISSASGTHFLHSFYLTSDEFEIGKERENDIHDPGHLIDAYYTKSHIVIPIGEMRQNLQIAVVGNVGNITGDVKTLGELRDYVATRSFIHNGASRFVYADCKGSDNKVKEAGGEYSNFAMGLFEEPRWLTTSAVEGSELEPHVVSVTLERLAARIDFNISKFPSQRSQEEDAFAPIPYEVKGKVDNVETTLAKNWITHCRIVNSMQLPSYSIRRTADDPNTTPNQYPATFLGTEKAVNNISQNYILTPYTRNITSASTNTLFGNTALNTSKEREFSSAERVVSRKAFAPFAGGYVGTASALAFDTTSPNYFIVGYTNENTLRPEDMTRDYTTGLLYRSIYEPATVYRLEGEGEDAHLVKDCVESLTTDVLSDGSCPAGGTKSEHYGKTFWMMERLVPTPTEADRVYFIADAEGDQEGDAAANGAGNTTVAGKTKIQKAAELYMTEHAETGWTQPLEYVGGVAYNYYWIRHSNSQGTGHSFSPMEYSIVRNNIYSVNITSFSGPGAPSTDPAMDNPDRIQPITYVHKWHPYTVEEVGM